MTRSEMVEQLKNEYRRRRAQAEREQDARVAEVESVDPQVHALWQKQARLLSDAVRAMAARTLSWKSGQISAPGFSRRASSSCPWNAPPT